MNSISPYKFLFCIGFIYALIGSGSWIFFRLGWMDYPTVIHGEWMMLGFLLSYVMGFLMTAIPRFLNAAVCKSWELIVAIILALLPLGGFWLSVRWVAAGGILQLFFLAYFVFNAKSNYFGLDNLTIRVTLLSSLLPFLFFGLNTSWFMYLFALEFLTLSCVWFIIISEKNVFDYIIVYI
jgi:hypothetical protein